MQCEYENDTFLGYKNLFLQARTERDKKVVVYLKYCLTCRREIEIDAELSRNFHLKKSTNVVQRQE